MSSLDRPDLSRRNFLRDAPLAGLTAVAGLKAAEIVADPVMIAIERHRLARQAFHAAVDRIDEDRAELEGREISDADRQAWVVTGDDEIRAFMTLLETPPATTPGLRAVLEYLGAYQAAGASIPIEPLFEALLASPILAA